MTTEGKEWQQNQEALGTKTKVLTNAKARL